MELKHYLQIVQRWAWLLVLGALLGGAGGYTASRLQEPVYQAYTRALVMRPPLEQSSDLTYYSDLLLAQTYVQLLGTQPVLDAASQRLGFDVADSEIKVEKNQDTQIIDVTVEDRSALRAAAIANVLVEVLIEQNEAMQIGRYASTEESIRAQIGQVDGQIRDLQRELDQLSAQNFEDQLTEVERQIRPLQEEVSRLQQEIAALQPANTPERRTQIAENEARIAQIEPLLSLYQQIYSNLVVLGQPVESGTNTNARQAQLQSTLALYQSLYLNLLNSLETVRLARLQNTPNVVQIEPAAVPEEPVRPRPVLNTALAAVVGLMLAAGVVFLREYLDNTIKTPEDVERVLGLPVLGFIAEMPYRSRKKEGIYVAQEPRSPISEAFRALRTNLEFASVQDPIQTIVVTSPGPSEGKSTVAVNLASILALSGKRVILVDADMRRPHVHRFIGMPNRDGLSNLFRNPALVHSVGRVNPDMPQLRIFTSGSLPPNPAELMGSKKMSQILGELCRMADIVVIDTPPSLVADAQILAGKVDAVLFVIQPGFTHAERARASLESFRRAGARVIGTVMNRIPRNRRYYYGGYEYYSPYSDSKGYYLGNGKQPDLQDLEEPAAPAAEPSREMIILDRTARLAPDPDELPSPDPKNLKKK